MSTIFLRDNEIFQVLNGNNNDNENQADREDCSRTGSLTASLIHKGLEKATDLENLFLNKDRNEHSAKFQQYIGMLQFI